MSKGVLFPNSLKLIRAMDEEKNRASPCCLSYFSETDILTLSESNQACVLNYISSGDVSEPTSLKGKKASLGKSIISQIYFFILFDQSPFFSFLFTFFFL